MNSLVQLVYYLSIIIITFLIGFPVVLLSKTEQENWIPKSFLYGTAVLTICTYWLSYISKSGLRETSRLLVAVLLVCAVAIYTIYRKRLLKYWKSLLKEDAINLLCCCVLGGVSLLLFVLFGAEFPYCDGYTYICNADYFLDYGYRAAVNPNDTILHPWLSQTLIYQAEHFRIGAQMLLALFSGIFNVSFSLEMFLPVTAYGVFLCTTSGWLFARRQYTENRIVKVITIVLIGANVPIILWNASYGFLPQVLGTAFFLASTVGILSFEEWKSNRNWSIVATAILIAAQALTYNEMLPFLVLITLIVIGRYFIEYKEERKQTLIQIFSCAVIAMLLIIVYMPGMIEATFTMLGATVGWHQDIDINTYVAYFLSTVPASYPFNYSFNTAEYSMQLYLLELLTLAFAAMVIIGFYKTKSAVKKEFFYVSLPYMAMMVYFICFTDNPFIGGKGNSWSIYKCMQYYFIVAVPYIAVFLVEAIGKISRMVLGAAILVFAAFNVCNAVNYMGLLSNDMKKYVGEEEAPLKEYYALYEKYGETQEIITLYDVPEKHRQMITYFLKDVKLASDWKTDGYYSMIPEEPKELFGTGINLVYNLNEENNVAGLVECDAKIVLKDGFYDTEALDGEYWNWSEKESRLDIIKYSADEKFLVSFELFSTSGNAEKITICSEDDKVIKLVEVKPNERIKVEMVIDSQINELHFKYSGKEVQDEKDVRKKAFSLSNYCVESYKMQAAED